MPKPTITEVAARAGVTKSTVSHALSGKRPVAPETRQRIEAAIAELGYRPNPVAQRLAAGRSRAVGFAFPPGQAELGLPDVPFVAAGASAASQAGYSLVLILPGANPSPDTFDLLGDGLLDGAILLRAGLRDERVEALRGGDLPFVMIGRTADNAGLSFVDVDLDAAVDSCVEHLRGLGHERLAFLRPAGSIGGAPARALQAYELACARRRIRLLTASGGPDAEGWRQAAAGLLRDHRYITGIVAWSEWAGWAAWQVAADAGLRVPDDLSIICLGQGVASELLPFAPTRVDLQSGPLAATAVRLLLEQLDAVEGGEQQVLLQPELIPGTTTASPRAS
jgi:DNA-binding LacI/PurR family transcriptional regulator